MSNRVAQHTDDVTLALILPAMTEEWADDLLAQEFDVHRADDGRLVVTQYIAGNCNAVVNARGFLSEVEDFLSEGQIDPMDFTLEATSAPPKAANSQPGSGA